LIHKNVQQDRESERSAEGEDINRNRRHEARPGNKEQKKMIIFITES
jgi:hypothetical protein